MVYYYNSWIFKWLLYIDYHNLHHKLKFYLNGRYRNRKRNGFVLLQTFDSLDIDYTAGFGRHYFINIQCKSQPNHKCVPLDYFFMKDSKIILYSKLRSVDLYALSWDLIFCYCLDSFNVSWPCFWNLGGCRGWQCMEININLASSQLWNFLFNKSWNRNWFLWQLSLPVK